MTESRKAFAFLIPLAVIATQTKAFTAQKTNHHSFSVGNITEAHRSSALQVSDSWAKEPERQMFPSITSSDGLRKVVCEPRPHVLVVHIIPEVVYIGDISTLVHCT